MRRRRALPVVLLTGHNSVVTVGGLQAGEAVLVVGPDGREVGKGIAELSAEEIRAVRGMTEAQAQDYLAAKSDALRFVDGEGGREESLKQFLDEKVFRPGLGNYDRDIAAARKK